MLLTKLQRHTAYIIMLAEVEEIAADKEECFLCHIAEDVFDFSRFDEDEMMEMLPELYSKKPGKNSISGGWFGTFAYQSRRNILNQCIEETWEEPTND